MKMTVKQFLERAETEHWAASMVENIQPGEYMVFHNGYVVEGLMIQDMGDDPEHVLVSYSGDEESAWVKESQLIDVYALVEPIILYRSSMWLKQLKDYIQDRHSININNLIEQLDGYKGLLDENSD